MTKQQAEVIDEAYHGTAPAKDMVRIHCEMTREEWRCIQQTANNRSDVKAGDHFRIGAWDKLRQCLEIL